MKTRNIYTLVIIAIMSITNITIGRSDNAPKIYNNTIENKEEMSKTVSLYEGINDMNLKPTEQYIVKFNTEGNPIQKIHHQWNLKDKSWQITDRYTYVYDSNGKVQTMTHSTWSEDSSTWNDDTEFTIYHLELNSELLSLNTF